MMHHGRGGLAHRGAGRLVRLVSNRPFGVKIHEPRRSFRRESLRLDDVVAKPAGLIVATLCLLRRVVALALRLLEAMDEVAPLAPCRLERTRSLARADSCGSERLG